MKKFLVTLLFFWGSFCFAHETDSLFVPPKPDKPLRYCSSAKKWIELATADPNMVEITRLKGVRMDLRYATFDNVTGHDLYCGVQRAFVHKDAAAKLRKAIKIMQREMPGSEFVIFDASRPLYAQEALRRTVRGTPYSAYVSSPGKGGMHNFGLALDLGITDADGNLLDMGTDFDSFERCAGEVGEANALKSGRLTQEQVDNRNKLRKIMRGAGWVTLGSEWWHFNAFPSKYVRENYPKFPL
ncbi:M15 family metallopeptidase [Fibrobacter sp.]|uniref:M15 family metallopeptidase n=1 Tax=Fibrobacter sp. TaxID=35828 RepID=UPI0025BD064E|nr:M15 family metallopeptidase [Fibrobacter sp.]MBS7271277.1 M15 family metallopeptidase [Fibrobacter sp.]MDD7498402.1 M15 family metallopeptidase [Fibrobacter sp.]MDY5723353.1 M15 family metallopeptidase [Fibrobacter sp.]